MNSNNWDVLISSARIQEGIRKLGLELTEIYSGKKIVVIPLLRGGFMFAADLVRNMNIDLQIEFLGAASYGEQTKSSGEVRLTLDTTLPLSGRDVLLVEDIVDTGLTLTYIQKLIKSRNPASLRTVVMLDKKARRQVDVDIYRCVFDIPDRFVFGYGLDNSGGFGRNLPDIVAIKD